MDIITNEDVIKTFPEIKGWRPDTECMSGSLFWYSDEGMDGIIYATPNWEESGKVSPSFCNYDGEYKIFAEVSLVGTPENQLEIYRKIVELAIDNFENFGIL